ncbi:TolC family protein [Brevibacillus borstelensis]|uniref:TolC family protein n=1 Tax=Brevibacillus borstelensis TaxID=45462 RepID=UPI0004F24AF9|nr:TolC family protein [Brevibacillus borstelensis]KKX54733.1 membrane protein [Brevibacillus borstelensis cifa_chp40]
MNFPYSSKKWLTLSIAAVMATSIGVGAVASESGTAAPASQTQGSQQNDKATTAATADNSKADANKTDATKADTAATEDKAAANGTADAKATETKATETKATDAKNTSTTSTTGTTNTTTTTNTSTTNNTPAADSTASDQMTLAKAIELAMQNNSKILTARLEAKSADINQSLSYATTSAITADMMDSSLDAEKQKKMTRAQADLTTKLNDLAVKVTESQVKLGVQQAYYNLLHAEADLNLKKQSLNRAQTQLKVAKAAFDVGTKAKTDILQAEMGVAGAQAALAAAENTVEINRMKFNEIIGVDVNKKWKLAPENKQVAAPTLTLQQAQEKALAQRIEVQQKAGELDLAQLNVKLFEEWSLLSTYQGRIARNNVEKAKLAIDEQNRQIKMEVAENYLTLNAAKVAIDFKKKAQEAAAESYRLTNLRFENGLATTLEVIQAEEEYSDRENQYLEAIRNYNLAVVNFENALGVGK